MLRLDLPPFASIQVDELFQMADSNQSGTIDLDEFGLMIEGMNPAAAKTSQLGEEPLGIEPSPSPPTDGGEDAAGSPRSGGFNPFKAFA